MKIVPTLIIFFSGSYGMMKQQCINIYLKLNINISYWQAHINKDGKIEELINHSDDSNWRKQHLEVKAFIEKNKFSITEWRKKIFSDIKDKTKRNVILLDDNMFGSEISDDCCYLLHENSVEKFNFNSEEITKSCAVEYELSINLENNSVCGKWKIGRYYYLEKDGTFSLRAPIKKDTKSFIEKLSINQFLIPKISSKVCYTFDESNVKSETNSLYKMQMDNINQWC